MSAFRLLFEETVAHMNISADIGVYNSPLHNSCWSRSTNECRWSAAL